MRKPTALIADDERLMRDQLKLRLAQAWPDLLIVAEASNGLEAVALTRAHEPDIVFLDIRMPEMTGVEAARLIGGLAHIVFVTAYDQYAIEAFAQGALDYVLKPAELERLQLTCERLQGRLHTEPPQIDSLLATLTQRLGGGTGTVREYLRWIQANVGTSLRLIPTQDILFFRADDKYTRVQTEQFEALIRKPIKELVEELDPAEFWQIHRSTLVRVNAIAQVTRNAQSQQVVQVNGHPEKLEVSRAYSHLFKHM